MIDEAKCREIAVWSQRLHSSLGPDPRVVVLRDAEEGAPVIDTEHREVRVHPEDYLALRRWADRQALTA